MIPAPPPDLALLASLSARIGADPLLIQGAGGNTSVKEASVMWIKASGTQLADALTRDVFVPCDLPAMRAAMAADDPRADQPALFALQSGGLRPSIETSLHSVFPQRVVVHVHCVNTIALAIRIDAGAALAPRLAGFNWGQVGYAKPGANLARAVQAVVARGADVVVLENHGLIVAADDVAGAEALLSRVVAALTVAPRRGEGDMPALAAQSGAGFRAGPPDHPLHIVARHADLLAHATSGSLYPDHVVFCGVGAMALRAGENASEFVARLTAAGLPIPPFVLVAGAGVLIRDGATDAALGMIRCLGDVLLRLPQGAALRVLSDAENAALIDWDAEKYRQALNGQALNA